MTSHYLPNADANMMYHQSAGNQSFRPSPYVTTEEQKFLGCGIAGSWAKSRRVDDRVWSQQPLGHDLNLDQAPSFTMQPETNIYHNNDFSMNTSVPLELFQVSGCDTPASLVNPHAFGQQPGLVEDMRIDHVNPLRYVEHITSHPQHIHQPFHDVYALVSQSSAAASRFQRNTIPFDYFPYIPFVYLEAHMPQEVKIRWLSICLLRSTSLMPYTNEPSMAALDSHLGASRNHDLISIFAKLVKRQWQICHGRSTDSFPADLTAINLPTSARKLCPCLEAQAELLQSPESDRARQLLTDLTDLTASPDEVLNIGHLVYKGCQGIGKALVAARKQQEDCQSTAVELDLTDSTKLLNEVIGTKLSPDTLAYVRCMVLVQLLLSSQETPDIGRLRSWLQANVVSDLLKLNWHNPCSSLYLMLGDLWSVVNSSALLCKAPRYHPARTCPYGNDIVVEHLQRLRDIIVQSYAWVAAENFGYLRYALRGWTAVQPIGAWFRISLEWA